MPVSVLIPCCSDYYRFTALSEVWKGYASNFVFSSRLLWQFYINFRITCSSSVQNVMGNLIGIALNL